MTTYTLIDLVGIQEFVFASNRLKDVAGGSQLVREATSREGWLRELGLRDEVLVAAGGNVLLRFDDQPAARDATARFTRRLIDEAPGLGAAVAHEEAGERGFAGALERLHWKIRETKAGRRPSLDLLGLGVTESCHETGAVASEYSKEADAGRRPVPVAAGVVARRRALTRSDLIEEEHFSSGHGDSPRQLRFPIENDDLGRSPGEKSLLGVVHVDANAVGSRLAAWLREQGTIGGADQGLEARFTELSSALDALVYKTWRAVVDRTKARIRWRSRTRRYELLSPALGRSFPLAEKAQPAQLFLPLRPILLGGDDLTFLCDGRLALDLAEHALARFKSAKLPEIGAVGACAGVALVHAHAPFSRAVEWAHKLCARAKSRVVQVTGPDRVGFAIDWHVGLPSPQETVEGLRRRVYTSRHSADPQELTCRPYLLGDAGERETWRWLARTVLGAPTPEGGRPTEALRDRTWMEHRNKVKALEALAQAGREAIQESLEAWRAAHPDLKLPGGLNAEDGFIGNRTPLIDAAEILDLHWPLDPLDPEQTLGAAAGRSVTTREEGS
jgi:hypothetical protein